MKKKKVSVIPKSKNTIEKGVTFLSERFQRTFKMLM